ncbi:MAG TPA: ABC transporter permease [Steroidobacteraceae bacterium]|nr:ABC transporter permease [Steroidobacteraceae bacterium]
MKYFRLIWAGLWRKKVRTILTMLSIVFAFLLFGLVQGVNQGFNQAVNKLDVDRLYVTPRDSQADPLPISYYEQIKAIPGVKAASMWSYFGGYFRDSRNPIPAFATEPRSLFQVYKELKIKPEYLDAMDKTRTGALVSEALANKYGWKIGDRVPIGTSIWTQKSGSNTWYFDIVGTFDASAYGGGFPSFYLNQSYYSEAAAFGNNQTSLYLVRVEDPQKAAQVAAAIDAKFANSPAETRTQSESALMQRQLKQIGDINFIANMIASAVLFTLLFLTANTMAQSVRERTSELAVLKTLGYSDEKVLAMVLVESMLLCLFAAAIGLFFASSIFKAPQLKAIFGALGMPTIVLIGGSLIAIGLAIVSGLPPAVRAKRLNIVEALAVR